MKFSLTIATDNAAELAGILAQISGAGGNVTAVTFPTATMLAVSADEADGPADLNAPAFDSAGLPWDDRIHAASKTTNKDGTWRSKRGVTETTIAAVTAELRARAGTPYQPAPVAPVQQFQVPPTAVVQPEYHPPQTFQAPPVAPVQQFVAPPVASVQPEYHQPQTFQAPPVAPVQQQQGVDIGIFMRALQNGLTTVNPATGTPYVDQAYIASLVGRLSQHLQRQLHAITDIATDPNAINVAAAMVQQDGRWL